MNINTQLRETNVRVNVFKKENTSIRFNRETFPNGWTLKEYTEVHNIIASTGLTPAIKCIIGASGGGVQPAPFNWIGYGTSTNAASTSNTALIGEIGTRLQDTNPSFPAAGQGRLTVTFGTGDAGTISESGVFNSSAGNILLARTTFTGVVKSTGDSVQIIWDLTVSS